MMIDDLERNEVSDRVLYEGDWSRLLAQEKIRSNIEAHSR